MWTIKNKKAKSAPHAHLISWMEEGCFSEKKSFTRMQIKPKILYGRKPEMTGTCKKHY